MWTKAKKTSDIDAEQTSTSGQHGEPTINSPATGTTKKTRGNVGNKGFQTPGSKLHRMVTPARVKTYEAALWLPILTA